MREALLDKGFGHRLAKEDDVGLDQVRLTDQTPRWVKAGHDLVRQHDVTVGAELPRDHLEVRVRLTQPLIEVRSAGDLATVQAPGQIEVAVQLEDVLGAGNLMQAIDILRDDRPNQAQALKIRDRAVPVVGSGAREPSPSDEAAGPVTLPIRRRGNELAIRHWHHPSLAVRPPVVRDARLR